MPAIFAIDGAEDLPDGLIMGEFGAYSSAVAALQTALVTLGNLAGDSTLRVLAVDGLIGPKTTAATNIAFTRHIGPGQAPDNYRTGALTQSFVGSNAGRLAPYVESENQRRSVSTGAVMKTVTKATTPGTTAMVPYQDQGPPLPANLPASAIMPSLEDDSRATLIKWSAIGLGVVSLAGLAYLFLKRRGTLGDCCGLGDFGMKGDRINDRERERWVNNDEGLYRWWKSHRGSMRDFIKKNRAEIDAVIRGVRDRPAGRGLMGNDMAPYSYNIIKKMAENQWTDVWSVEEVDTPPGTVVRRVEGKMGKHRGQPLAQQFKVRLHSNRGPIHWIAVREDGTMIFDGWR